jgi:hypothetical protein
MEDPALELLLVASPVPLYSLEELHTGNINKTLKNHQTPRNLLSPLMIAIKLLLMKNSEHIDSISLLDI